MRDTVTYTTRQMRTGESEGNPYHFVTREKFDHLVSEGFFVEWAKVHSNMYGTPYYQLHEAWAKNEVIIMDVDVQGAATFKAKFPDAIGIFILPPSLEELRRRIIGRDKVVPEDMEIRMVNAVREMDHAGDFDYRVVNDNFEKSFAEFKKIVEELLARD